MDNIIFPERLPDLPKKVRGAKEFSVITTKKKEDVLNFHCSFHPAVRMIKLREGWICGLCGCKSIAIKVVQTEQQ